MAKKQRLDKAIAMQGALSRSEVKTLIRKGEVTVNGQVVKSADYGVDFDSDTIAVQGRELTLRQHLYLMMNKPKGVVSASEDRHERTVVDLVPEHLFRKGLFPAGRLDKDTTGFVLLTDDGAFAHRILSPRSHIPKTYIATLDKPVPPTAAAAFAGGMEMDGKVLQPAQLTILSADPPRAQVVLRQGIYLPVPCPCPDTGRPARKKRMLSYPFRGSFQHRLCALDDVPDDVRRRLDFVDHGGNLAGEEAAVFQVALDHSLSQRAAAQGF